MSEYQYYEFRAIDRKLSEKEIRTLRGLSTRASITPTSFINEYNFGNFRGSPEKLMETCFDAHLYVANWGSHRLMLRIPRRSLSEKTAAQYCAGRLAEAHKKGAFVILDFSAEEDSGDGDWEEGGAWLASLIQIRADILRGDLRALYLGWLLCAQSGEVEEDELEPPVPQGLGRLSASLDAFAEFLRIDPELIEVASAERRSDDPAAPGMALGAWIDALPIATKNEYLRRIVEDDGPRPRLELLQMFQRAQGKRGEGRPGDGPRRSAGSLLAAARARGEAHQRRAAEREARERAKAETKIASARKKRIAAVAADVPAAWRKVEAHIAIAAPRGYDEAVRLLVDLRDLAVRDGNAGSFTAELKAVRDRHKTKSALRKRIDLAGLRSKS